MHKKYTTKSHIPKHDLNIAKYGHTKNQCTKTAIPKISLNVYQTDACKINIPKNAHTPKSWLQGRYSGHPKYPSKSDNQSITKVITKIDNKFHDTKNINTT